MLDALAFLGALGVVEAIQRAHQIAGDAAYALEFVIVLGAAALRTGVADDAVVAAHRVAVDRMVDRAVAYAALLHVAHNALKGLEVGRRVAVHLDIGDVAGVGQLVIGRFQTDLFRRADGEIDRYVEAVGVVFVVGDALDRAENLAIHAHEAAGQALGGRRQQRDVHVELLAVFVAAAAHMADDLQTQRLRILALAVMLAGERLERLGQANKADRQRAVLEHLAHLVVPAELLAAQPHALTHQERAVVDVLGGLNLEARHKLIDGEVDQAIQLAPEEVHVALRADGDAGQVDRGEAQIAAAIGDFLIAVIDVGHDARAAAHIGHFGFGMARLVVFEVVGRVLEGEVRE